MNNMLFGVGLIQLVLILATIYIANERNRNPVVWGVAAIYFPLVTLIVVALLDPLSPLPPPQGARPTLAVCPGCGRIAADPTARFCAACGVALPAG